MYNSDMSVGFEVLVSGSKEVVFWDEMFFSV